MSQKVAWITGGSSGIGAATALRLAKQGWLVAITGTSPGKLEIVADKDPQFIKSYPGDVTKLKTMAELVDQIETNLGPIDLVILNAGIYVGDDAENFTAANFKKHVDINLMGIANCLEPVLQKFLQRGYGHIAITASVAGYRGLPHSISYSATKAALINMAESIAIELYRTAIKIQVICPGFIKTPMTDGNNFKMPLLMDVDKAAEKLVDGLKSKAFEIVFPWQFCWFLKLSALLPHRVYIWAGSKVKDKTKSSS